MVRAAVRRAEERGGGQDKKPLTANDLYQLFVGEIGITRREFLYQLQFWEARRIIRGYRNRYRDMWSAIRWHAYNVMSAMPYTDLRKAGIRSPRDLIEFDWDKDAPADLPTEEEAEDMLQMLRDMNSASQ